MSEEKEQYEEIQSPAEDFNSDSLKDEQFDERPDEQSLDEQSLDEILAEDQSIEDEFLASGDEDEAAEKIRIIASDPPAELTTESLNGTSPDSPTENEDEIKATRDE